MKKLGVKSKSKKRAFNYWQLPFQLHTSQTSRSNKKDKELNVKTSP